MPDLDILEPDPREDLLARVLSGELAIDEAPVQAAMQADAGFAEELRELLALRDELAVAEAGGQTADAEANEPWSGADDAIARLVQQELGDPRDTSAGRRWRLGLIAAAAAAGLLIAVSFWPKGGGDGQGGQLPNAPDTTQLGAFELWPTGTVARADFELRGLHWGDLGAYAQADLTLSVFDANGAILVDEADVTGTTRFAPPDAAFSLPSFRWQLTASMPGRRDKSWRATVKTQ